MHIIAAKAVAFHEALQPDFKEYQKNVRKNAAVLAEALTEGGVRLVSGGTDNHLMLVDLGPLGVSGKDAETWLDIAGITVNKNAIPFDPKPPRITSGIRVGTPALTSRGMGAEEMKEVAAYIIEVLKSGGEESKLKSIAEKVKKLCNNFPIY
jgi:glycine hydroxymethyltransferase